ncbi:MAG TPA: MarR family winged helix-turn-helix transcriptional regulator [Sphingomicrobium sp.]
MKVRTMDASAQPYSAASGDYCGPPPILIAASSNRARRRALDAAEFAGYRTAAVAVEDAVDRLNLQAAASAIWLELDRDDGATLDRLLDRVEAESDRLPAIVSAPSTMIDPVTARLQGEGVHLLFDATDGDRIAALAVATSWARARSDARAHDISKEPDSARLRQLSDEVSRIAATLARLSTGPAAAGAEKLEPPSGDAPQVSLDQVRQVIRARRLRARYFDAELFADPAWDMLLDLLQAEIAQHRVPVSSLCIAAAVPPTTALRWIKTMTDAGLFKRRSDPHDGRRVFVELAPKASGAMRRYFAEAGKVAII